MKKIFLSLAISLAAIASLRAQESEKLSALTRTNVVNATDDVVVNSTNNNAATKYSTRRATVAALFSGRDGSGMTNMPGMLNVRDFGAKGDGTTDDTAAISNALYRVSVSSSTSTWVYVPPGIYKMTSNAVIYSNTRLTLDPQARLLRGSATTDNLIRNYADGTTGGYGAASNIVVEGGIWDGNKSGFTGDSTLLAFGHARNVTVRDAVFANLPGTWHFIEFNSTKQGSMINCTFTNETGSEAVQLDLMADSGAFPWFGPYDSTPCESILVQHCYWNNVQEGIGSHRLVDGFPHHNIIIRDCTFTNFTGVAIRGYDWSQVMVDGNFAYYGHRFYDTDIEAFDEDVDPGTRRSDIKIINNYVRDMIRDGTQDRGIKIKWANNVMVSGNTLTNISRHGIGIDWPCANFQVSGNQISACGQLAGTGQGIYIFGACEGSVIGNVISNCLESAITIGSVAALNTSTNVTVVGNSAPTELIQLNLCSNVIAYANICSNFVGQPGITTYDLNGRGTNTIYQPNAVWYSTNSGAGVTADFSRDQCLLSTNAAFTFLSPINVSSSQYQKTLTWVTNTTAAMVAITCPNAGVTTGQTKTNGTWNVTNLTKIEWEHYGLSWTNAKATPVF